MISRVVRKITPRIAAEQAFCVLGLVAEQGLRQSLASGNTRLEPERPHPANGEPTQEAGPADL